MGINFEWVGCVRLVGGLVGGVLATTLDLRLSRGLRKGSTFKQRGDSTFENPLETVIWGRIADFRGPTPACSPVPHNPVDLGF